VVVHRAADLVTPLVGLADRLVQCLGGVLHLLVGVLQGLVVLLDGRTQFRRESGDGVVVRRLFLELRLVEPVHSASPR
jgi:hypothetical protein